MRTNSYIHEINNLLIQIISFPKHLSQNNILLTQLEFYVIQNGASGIQSAPVRVPSKEDRRRRASIKTTMAQRHVFTGKPQVI